MVDAWRGGDEVPVLRPHTGSVPTPQVLKLVRAGVAFAQRREAAGAWEPLLGRVRKGVLRRAVELPVQAVTDALRQAVV